MHVKRTVWIKLLIRKVGNLWACRYAELRLSTHLARSKGNCSPATPEEPQVPNTATGQLVCERDQWWSKWAKESIFLFSFLHIFSSFPLTVAGKNHNNSRADEPLTSIERQVMETRAPVNPWSLRCSYSKKLLFSYMHRCWCKSVIHCNCASREFHYTFVVPAGWKVQCFKSLAAEPETRSSSPHWAS